ncbi:potassium voltage-gated channel subfamily A member 2-like [Clytia hemisphaerica]|uniref:Uncharacterized protein n=1 Tax=Clytia hemisphaerica TaxID=252671 RepID=A0A7M5V428_9CNID
MQRQISLHRKAMQQAHIIKTKQKVFINVQGSKYETYEGTLQQFPNTLLGDPVARSYYYSTQLKAYYFDIKPELFEAVLFFYQSSGILSKPTFSSDVEFKQTLQFFGLIKSNKKKIDVNEMTFRDKLWDILEHPHRSKIGMYGAYISFAIILISVAMFCWETEWHRGRPHSPHERKSTWFIGECLYITFFAIEYLLRLWSSPNRIRFAVTFLGIIDLFSIVPFFIALFYSFYSQISNLRILRLLQILRIIKLSRYNSGLKILAQAILSCRRQMFSLTILFMITIVFVSTFVYVAESDVIDGKGFESIPETMWFAVISMTTVGYGDVVPKTTLGKLSGAVGIFMGTVVLFHLFLPIYLMYFSLFYGQEKEKNRLEQEAKHKAKILKGFSEATISSPETFYFRKKNLTLSPAVSSRMSRLSADSDSSTSDIDLHPEDGNYSLAVPVRRLAGTSSSYVL